MEQSGVKLPEFHFVGTDQWSWAEIWNAVGVDASLILNRTMLTKVLGSERRTYIDERGAMKLCI